MKHKYNYAFPLFVDDTEVYRGMTLRDYVAAQVLTGLCAGDWKLPIDDQTWAKAACRRCFEIADEFMEARK